MRHISVHGDQIQSPTST